MIMILNYQALQLTLFDVYAVFFVFVCSSSFFYQPEMPYDMIRDYSSSQLCSLMIELIMWNLFTVTQSHTEYLTN